MEALGKQNRSAISAVIFLVSVFIAFPCGVSYAGEHDGQYIRVAVIKDVRSLRLKVEGPYEIRGLNDKDVVYEGRNLNGTVTCSKGSILFGKMKFKSNKLSIFPKNGQALFVNSRPYRGSINLIKADSLKFTVVNALGLEDYLNGILFNEVSHYWPVEALKAQAVVCRTYAVYQIQRNKNRDFDVTSDIYSQVYGGRTSERYRTNKAVEDTRGVVLLFRGKIFPAYFHSTCAGHTEDASKLWGGNPYTMKGSPCDFCKDSPHFNWHAVLTLSEIEKRLKAAGSSPGSIKGIEILGRNDSGRITDLNIRSSKGNLVISGKDFRQALGPEEIRSTNFSVRIMERDAVFEGVGWGHGAGLCQWGAYFMAKSGSTSEKILKYYYPGTQLSSVDN